MTLFLRDSFAARHPAGIDVCPSTFAHGTGHDSMVSVLTRAGTAM